MLFFRVERMNMRDFRRPPGIKLSAVTQESCQSDSPGTFIQITVKTALFFILFTTMDAGFDFPLEISLCEQYNLSVKPYLWLC